MTFGEYLGAGSAVTKGLYKLNGNSNDTSGNANNGTDTNIAYSQASGFFGEGVNVTAQGGIAIPTGTFGTIGTGDFTVSFRLNPAQPGGGRYPMLFGSYSTSSPFAGPNIFFDPLNVNGGGNAMMFRLRNTNQQFVTSPSASSFYGKRLNIIFTRISGECYAYYDGFLVKQFSDNQNIGAAGDAFIFSRGNSNEQTQPTGAKGDEFILETKGWTAVEIQKYYTHAKGRFGIL